MQNMSHVGRLSITTKERMVDMGDDELSEKVYVYLKNMEILRPCDWSVSPSTVFAGLYFVIHKKALTSC